MSLLEKLVLHVPFIMYGTMEVDAEGHDIQVPTLLIIENGLPSGLPKE